MDSTTNIWLAIIAVSSFVQAALFVVAALMLKRAASRMDTAIDRVSQDIRQVTGRVASVDDDIRKRFANAEEKMSRAAAVVKFKVWPAVALARGVGAAVNTLRRGTPPVRNPDPKEVARFVSEGGSHVQS